MIAVSNKRCNYPSVLGNKHLSACLEAFAIPQVIAPKWGYLARKGEKPSSNAPNALDLTRTAFWSVENT